MNAMFFFIVLAFLATVGMLIAGGYSMLKGGKYDEEHSVEFMQGRVVLQLLTLGLVAIATFAWV
ncbi:MAG: twin transmembrane helix small protein [gamma proteobacterium symbiont of Bathyaustriella thionipta]|nr:twin transmembrane helix small protein [gamma proteobacterium symbiont of Bathyaustriella thionipta]